MLKVPEPVARAATALRPAQPRQRYYAFLSYSHKDKETADWLQRALEQFRVPAALVGQLTANGSIPRKLTPIFRDEHELGAARELSEEIEGAIASSQFLIVVCSPAAAQSRWTNAEIAAFKRTRPDGCVLAAIIEGEPFASDIPGREGEECFPPALRHRFDRRGRQTAKRAEPLAADLREAGDERRTGLLKLVAGLLGVGLDQLVQREATQRHRRLAWFAAASLAGMALTSALAITAIQARDAARDQRREAEGLVAFMLGDLKDKLEPIGRLDALDGVGSRVLAYYSKQDASSLSDAALLQRSRALSLTAQVAYLRGDQLEALRLYQQAQAGTAEAVRRSPEDPDRLFDHAQNLFWIGELARFAGQLRAAEAHYREYKSLADRLVALEPDNLKWRMEVLYGIQNVGIVLYYQRRYKEAAEQFESALGPMQALSSLEPRNRNYAKEVSTVLAWLADAQRARGQLGAATRLRERQVHLLQRFATAEPADVGFMHELIPAHQALGILLTSQGRTEPGIAQLRHAVEGADRLLPLEPANAQWKGLGAQARLWLARTLVSTGQERAAMGEAREGCALAAEALARDSAGSWRSLQTQCYTVRSTLALKAGSQTQALQLAGRALASARTERNADPIVVRYNIAAGYRLLGDAHQAAGDSARAASAWSAGLSQLPRAGAEKPAEMLVRAELLQRLGETTGAVQIAARLNALGYRGTI